MTDLKDTLDAGLITSSKVDIKYRNGYVFSKALRIAISFFTVVGLGALFSGGAGYIIGPILLFFGLYALTAHYGTEISLNNNYVKSYSSSFGVKKGKWKPTLLLTDISVLKMGKTVHMQQSFGTSSVQLDNNMYEVYLLAPNHRKRMLLRETNSGKEAIETAQYLSEKMNKNLVEYNPQISQRTKNMRYERH